MATKSWLAKKNISQDGVVDELFELGYRSTPVIVTDTETIVGFNVTRLAEALL